MGNDTKYFYDAIVYENMRGREEGRGKRSRHQPFRNPQPLEIIIDFLDTSFILQVEAETRCTVQMRKLIDQISMQQSRIVDLEGVIICL